RCGLAVPGRLLLAMPAHCWSRSPARPSGSRATTRRPHAVCLGSPAIAAPASRRAGTVPATLATPKPNRVVASAVLDVVFREEARWPYDRTAAANVGLLHRRAAA